MHRNPTIYCCVLCSIGYYLDIIITARLEICFETTRDVLDAQVSVRTLEKIGYLAAKRLGTVNCLTAKSDVSKEILPPFMNRHRHSNLTAPRQKFVTWSVDYDIQETFGNIKPLHQMRALLQI